jgi:hypothetical protein
MRNSSFPRFDLKWPSRSQPRLGLSSASAWPRRLIIVKFLALRFFPEKSWGILTRRKRINGLKLVERGIFLNERESRIGRSAESWECISPTLPGVNVIITTFWRFSENHFAVFSNCQCCGDFSAKWLRFETKFTSFSPFFAKKHFSIQE